MRRGDTGPVQIERFGLGVIAPALEQAGVAVGVTLAALELVGAGPEPPTAPTAAELDAAGGIAVETLDLASSGDGLQAAERAPAEDPSGLGRALGLPEGIRHMGVAAEMQGEEPVVQDLTEEMLLAGLLIQPISRVMGEQEAGGVLPGPGLAVATPGRVVELVGVHCEPALKTVPEMQEARV